MPNVSLKQALAMLYNGDTEFYGGTVVAANPLSVRLQDDSELVIGEALLIVPEHLTNRNVKMVIDGSEKTVKVCEALKKDDDVILISINRGDQYLIIGRF